jgi:hypothetical protein
MSFSHAASACDRLACPVHPLQQRRLPRTPERGLAGQLTAPRRHRPLPLRRRSSGRTAESIEQRLSRPCALGALAVMTLLPLLQLHGPLLHSRSGSSPFAGSPLARSARLIILAPGWLAPARAHGHNWGQAVRNDADGDVDGSKSAALQAAAASRRWAAYDRLTTFHGIRTAVLVRAASSAFALHTTAQSIGSRETRAVNLSVAWHVWCVLRCSRRRQSGCRNPRS